MSDRHLGASEQEQTVHALRRTTDALRGVENAVNNMASKEWVENLRREDHQRRRNFSILVIGVAVGFILVFILLLLGLVQLTQVSNSNRQISQENQRNLDYLIECTTASHDPDDPHECFEKGQRRTGNIVQQIARATADEIERRNNLGSSR